MRTRKELIYLNIKDLTQEEIEKLGDYDLSSCDICGEIELSERLIWLNDNELIAKAGDNLRKTIIRLLRESKISICDVCIEKEMNK